MRTPSRKLALSHRKLKQGARRDLHGPKLRIAAREAVSDILSLATVKGVNIRGLNAAVIPRSGADGTAVRGLVTEAETMKEIGLAIAASAMTDISGAERGHRKNSRNRHRLKPKAEWSL